MASDVRPCGGSTVVVKRRIKRSDSFAVRHGSLLQPRPKTQKVTIPPTVTPYQPGGGKGKGKGKGKAGMKGKRSDTSGKPTWVTEANIGGKKMNLCMMYQSNTCQRGDQCRFGHFCAFPLANGQACGQKHSSLTDSMYRMMTLHVQSLFQIILHRRWTDQRQQMMHRWKNPWSNSNLLR